MERIVLGEKLDGKKYDFRETCFGICIKDNKMLLVKKNNQYSFIGGGKELGESYEDCLRREFIEEAGYEIIDIKPFITIDCFWLAGGKWPLESLANFFVVEVGKKISNPLEDDCFVEEQPLDDVNNLLPLPYHKKALELYVESIKNYK